MSRKKGVAISSLKKKDKVRKTIAGVKIYELDADKNNFFIAKKLEIESMTDANDETKNILTIHLLLTLLTNVRIDVQDEEFIEMLKSPSLEFEEIMSELSLAVLERGEMVKRQIERSSKMAQLTKVTG